MDFLKSFIALLEGLWTVFKHLFKKSVTLQYPDEYADLPVKFRGKHELGSCVGCGICIKACPSQAVSIKKTNNKVHSYSIDLSKCIFCGNCQYHCPVNAIKMTKEYELASDNKAALNIELVLQNENYKGENN